MIHNEPTPKAFAKLYGEPFLKIPENLYIPPDALEVFLGSFEGPLDLLLYLIRKQNFNILDIPLAHLTQQYLLYIDEIQTRNLELAADYLLMAAMLIEIKSRLLLPVITKPDDPETEDPRAELARRLIEYEQLKLAAEKITHMPTVGHDFWVAQAFHDPLSTQNLPQVNPNDLQQAWLAILKRAQLVQHHTITQEVLSVREHMASILRTLQTKQFVEFYELFNHATEKSIVVVHFIALLELTRESLVKLTQTEAYAPIYVQLLFK